ncbi:type II secretion system secretin GspD [Lysobacter sp. H23M47]|uniref:type II secretion system secretin GspD n=1 Tax=Lysobacter sp. H23M47 TaxID=2781024 RepID=UPI0018821405|nr:type II secretion system secretin GspD [Lysobacter sp. H23M47]QOW24970.1 type II secretion system secretin GspD [Lysobacter sp. H23M47]
MKQHAIEPFFATSRPRLPVTARVSLRVVVASLVVMALLAGCASGPVPSIRRDAVPRTADQATRPGADGVQTHALGSVSNVEPDRGGPRPQIRRGTGRFIDTTIANSRPPGLPATTGEATFNFEGESLHGVVKAILGDMLGQNYVIAPGVQGTVTLATPKPVSAAEAINLLDQVLGWNNARMIYSGGRYNVVAADQPLAGTVAPRAGGAASARGFELRTVPLRYVSAEEMKKILEPYARPNAIVDTDASRNVITVGGTRAELQNYLRTIELFDVDWLAGMSVGVYPLQSGKAVRVVEDLEKVFGQESKSPVAGMFRFMPLEGTNAVMVITSQPAYLDEIQQWLDRIDGAGGAVQLYSYQLKYIKARDLADRLAEVFGGSSGGGDSGGGDRGPSLMPGLDSAEITSGEDGSSMGFGDKGGSSGGSGGASLSLGSTRSGNASVSLEIGGDKVGVSAVEETNALLVRSTPQAWQSIRDVIGQLDVMPMQVHIEAQVVEVQLSGELEYGVNWFFENAVTDNDLPSALGRTTWSTLAGSVGDAKGTAGGLAWTFLGRNAAAVIKALDSVTDVNMLQTPSVVVRNNAEATFNVGSRIPVSSVTVNPGLGNDTSYSQVQYLDTGVILTVRPRITKDGMVFLDIVQEVSAPGGEPDRFGNVRIDTRKLKTEAAIQSGDTVMLAGLIRDSAARGSRGFPGLNRIPVLGGLFGTQSSVTRREETIVLLTPKIIRDPNEARELTDEYGRRFRALQPLRAPARP